VIPIPDYAPAFPNFGAAVAFYGRCTPAFFLVLSFSTFVLTEKSLFPTLL